MSVTLADLRRLLEGALKHTDAPAILRLPEAERTVEGVARAYLLRVLWLARESADNGYTGGVWTDRMPMLARSPSIGAMRLDLHDSGTAHALVVAHALYLGIDPGENGIGVMWVRDAGRGYARYLVMGQIAPEPHPDRAIFDDCKRDDDSLISVRVVAAPTVALEADPIRALELAVRHVLEAA